jgi:hypothetical protein
MERNAMAFACVRDPPRGPQPRAAGGYQGHRAPTDTAMTALSIATTFNTMTLLDDGLALYASNRGRHAVASGTLACTAALDPTDGGKLSIRRR